MASLSKTTKDHDEIRKWAEERGGKPSHIKRTGGGDDPGILRIDFPGFSGEGSLDEISWDEFFEKFDEQNLSLIYQEHTAAGERSNFNKFVSAQTAANATKKKASSKKPAFKQIPAKKAAAKKNVAKKTAPLKKAAKKSAVKKVTAKKAVSKKAPLKKVSSSKKTAAKKVASKKSAAKRR